MSHHSIINGSVLYYPSIEFPDDGFMKSALCIWDTIYRIVPHNYDPHDSDEVKVAVQEGAIRNITLNKKDLETTSEEFLDFLTGTPFIPAGLEGNEINLHKDKVDDRLYPFLKEIARKIDGDWIKLSERIVHGYMMFLANNVCKHRNIPKITDNSDVFSLMAYFEHDGQFDEWVTRENSKEYYSTIILPTLIPAGVEATDINNIMRFREKTETERAGFRNSICDFMESVKNIEDHEYVIEITEKLKFRFEEAKNTMIEKGITSFRSFLPSFLAVGAPIAYSSISSMGMDNPFFLTQVLGSLFVGSIAALADSYSKSKSWLSKDASYYLQLRDNYEDGTSVRDRSIPRFDRVFEEFIND